MPATVKGGVELRKALFNFAPELGKETQKEIASVLKPVVKEARGFVTQSPLSNWAREGGRFPRFDASVIKRGIGYKTTPSKPNRAGFVNTVRIQNKSMTGAIFETAGRKNGQGQDWVGPKAGGASKGVSRSNNPYAGNQFISNLGQLYGSNKKSDHRMMGRLIFRAWDKTQGRANAAIFKSIENTTAKFNRRTAMVDVRRAA